MPNRRSPWMDAVVGAAGAIGQQLMQDTECQKELRDLRQEVQILRAVCGNRGGSGMPRSPLDPSSPYHQFFPDPGLVQTLPWSPPGFNTPQYGAPSDAGNLFGQLGQMQQGNPNIAPGPLPGGPATPPWSPNIQPNWLGPGFKGQF